MDLADGHMGSVLSKLGQLVKEEYNLPAEAKQELNSLARYLRRLQACHCSMKEPPPEQLQAVQGGWVSQSRDLFYDADNFVDSLLVCSKRSAKPDGFKRFFNKTRDDSSSSSLSHQIVGIEQIKVSAMDLLGQFIRYCGLYKEEEELVGIYGPTDALIKLLGEGDGEKETARKKKLLSIVGAGGLGEKEPELVGIDGPKDALLKMLTEGDGDLPKKQMKILSIVGAGGLGKTTLARAVYHQLRPQFDCGAFVTVDPFDRSKERFFAEMLHQLHVKSYVDNVEEARDVISKFLRDKRYLIVSDHLWTKEDWHGISCSLPNNDYGSRVIITTRIHDIANFCCLGFEESIYEIQRLGYQDSKELFLKQFFGGEDSCPNGTTDVFDEILKMCGGTPSAIKSIASLLASKVTVTNPWQEMMNSIYSACKKTHTSLHSGSENIPGFEDLRYIVLLTYLHLPSTLKDCLLYIVVHAKNRMIHRTTIVRKWFAEGFISEYVARCGREEAARQYFEEFINRNFIKLVEYGNYLGEEIYEVNFIVLYVLRLLSHQDNFATFLSEGDISSKCSDCVRLSIQCSGSELLVHTEKMASSRIRSLTIVGPAKFYINKYLVYLRVLDLDGCQNLDNSAMVHICRMLLLKYMSLKHTEVTEIPPEIGEQRHLEILDIRHNRISNLPPEIRLLQNLDTLDVRHTQVREFPKELVQLHKLVHLYFGQSSTRGLKFLAGSDLLKSVKVLGTVDSREMSGSAMEEISGLTGVTELEVVLHDRPADKDQDDKLLSSVSKCKNLEYLIIYGDYSPGDVRTLSLMFPRLAKLKVAGRFVKVPWWFAQLSTLKKLNVRVYKLDQDDLKILGALPVLRTLALTLIRIPRTKEVAITSRLHPEKETSLASFMTLEVFSFDCHVPWITFEQGAMPSLKLLHLKLYPCPADKFPSGTFNLRKLEKIIIRYSSHYARSAVVTKMVYVIGLEAAIHDNLIDLSITENDEVFTVMGGEASSHGNLVQAANTSVDKRLTDIENEECT